MKTNLILIVLLLFTPGCAEFNEIIDAVVDGTIQELPDEIKPPIDQEPTNNVTESLKYWGRHNGDRPTWYGNKTMNAYPSGLHIIIEGCLDRKIKHNGNRYDNGGLIVKQSDVPGRGLAVVYAASCKSKVAKISW